MCLFWLGTVNKQKRENPTVAMRRMRRIPKHLLNRLNWVIIGCDAFNDREKREGESPKHKNENSAESLNINCSFFIKIGIQLWLAGWY